MSNLLQRSERVPPGRLRAILFDFGGVLAEEGFREGLGALARAQGLDPARLVEAAIKAVHESGYVLGAGAEADFWQLLRQRTGLVGTDRALTREILKRFTRRPWMLDHATALHAAGYLVAILSNQTDWLERLDRDLHFSRHFDRVFNSYRLGRSKRDPAVFDEVVMELGVTPDETLFIDDQPGNVERARAQGLNALRYRDRESFERELGAWVDVPLQTAS